MTILDILIQYWMFILPFYPTSSNALALSKSQALPGYLLQRSTNIPPNVATCTTDSRWMDPTYPNPMIYAKSCFAALKLAREAMVDNVSAIHFNENFEFYSIGKIPYTKALRVQLPWIFTGRVFLSIQHSCWLHIDAYIAEAPEPETSQCVLAIAMIDSLGADFTLPEQLAGPFGNIDVSSPRQVMAATAKLFFECLQRGKQRGSDQWNAAFGWSQAGKF